MPPAARRSPRRWPPPTGGARWRHSPLHLTAAPAPPPLLLLLLRRRRRRWLQIRTAATRWRRRRRAAVRAARTSARRRTPRRRRTRLPPARRTPPVWSMRPVSRRARNNSQRASSSISGANDTHRPLALRRRPHPLLHGAGGFEAQREHRLGLADCEGERQPRIKRGARAIAICSRAPGWRNTTHCGGRARPPARRPTGSNPCRSCGESKASA